jgi:hypothetical protein
MKITKERNPMDEIYDMYNFTYRGPSPTQERLKAIFFFLSYANKTDVDKMIKWGYLDAEWIGDLFKRKHIIRVDWNMFNLLSKNKDGVRGIVYILFRNIENKVAGFKTKPAVLSILNEFMSIVVGDRVFDKVIREMAEDNENIKRLLKEYDMQRKLGDE